MSTHERGILSAHDLKKKTNRFVYMLMIAAILLMAATMLYPITVTFFNAFKENREVISFPPTYLPSSWQWDGFAEGWRYLDLMLYFKNTLWIYGGNMAVAVLVLGLGAFSLSKLNLPFRKGFTFFFLCTLFIPPTTYIIPNFLNLRDLGLLNSYWAFWLPSGANAFFLLLLKTFFDELNNELFEASRMDGASEFRTFFQIAMPLSVPIFMTLAIFTFAAVWNDWFWPSLVIHSSEKYPLSTAIYNYVIDVRRLNLNVKFAILAMVMVPPIVLFLFLQRYIMRGVQLTGIKG